MRTFPKELKCRRLLFDGSMGALLTAMGHKSDHPEEFCLTRPEVITGIHASYIDAGANVVITDSLGATPIRLGHSPLAGQAAVLTEAAVRCARAAAGRNALVALDVGPSGDFLQPAGRYTMEEMMDSFSVCIEAGKRAGADFVLLETMTDIAECRAAALAAKQSGLPIAASFTFSENGRTLTGGTPECAALTLAAAGANAVGINCSTGPEQMLSPLAAMRKVTPLPVIVQPNAGLPEIDAQGRAHYRFLPEDMLPHMQNILSAGACAIGGCCGTTPDHIRAFASLDLSSAPDTAWDGTTYICSARQYVALDDALENAAEISDVEDLYDLEDECAAILDLSDASEDDMEELMGEAQMATNVPLIFRCDDAAVLEKALLYYPGAAAAIAPEDCSEVCRKYGAVRIDT